MTKTHVAVSIYRILKNTNSVDSISLEVIMILLTQTALTFILLQ